MDLLSAKSKFYLRIYRPSLPPRGLRPRGRRLTLRSRALKGPRAAGSRTRPIIIAPQSSARPLWNRIKRMGAPQSPRYQGTTKATHYSAGILADALKAVLKTRPVGTTPHPPPFPLFVPSTVRVSPFFRYPVFHQNRE